MPAHLGPDWSPGAPPLRELSGVVMGAFKCGPARPSHALGGGIFCRHKLPSSCLKLGREDSSLPPQLGEVVQPEVQHEHSAHSRWEAE